MICGPWTQISPLLVCGELASVFVPDFHPGGGDRETDFAAECPGVQRIHTDDGGGLGQAIALDERQSHHLLPPFRHRALHRHAACHRNLECPGIGLFYRLKAGVVQEEIKQGVDAGYGGEPGRCKIMHEAGDVARVGD